MNEQELMKSIEEAKTIDEVWDVASKAGIDRASFDAMIEKADNEQDEEISETDLESVTGGSWLIRIGLFIYAKLQKIRQSRYQSGYDEEIMSDKRLRGTCENKK